MARMPCLAQASMIWTRSPCLRTVAVFSESQRWSPEKSRMSVLDASRRKKVFHACCGERWIGKQAGFVGEAEQFGKMQRRAGAFLATDHGEVILMAVEPRHEDDTGFVEPRRRLEDVS